MRRLIAVVVAAVISCVLFSPPSQAAQWDPKYPPIPVDRQPNLDRPSGDDGGWQDGKLAQGEPLIGFSVGIWLADLYIEFVVRLDVQVDSSKTQQKVETNARPGQAAVAD